MAFQVLRILKKQDPVLFKDAGATCVRGYCNEPNGPECPRYVAVVKAQMDGSRKAAEWIATHGKEPGGGRSNGETPKDQ
jgi:hypothetical protein